MNQTTTRRCVDTAISHRCNYKQAADHPWNKVNINRDHTLQDQEHSNIKTHEEHHSLPLPLGLLADSLTRVDALLQETCTREARVRCDLEVKIPMEAPIEPFRPERVALASSSLHLKSSSMA